MLFDIQRQLVGNADDGGRNSDNNDRCIDYPYVSNGAGNGRGSTVLVESIIFYIFINGNKMLRVLDRVLDHITVFPHSSEYPSNRTIKLMTCSRHHPVFVELIVL